ncbi:MAG TPA: hypothetical protein VGR21_08875 [Cryptosporangiaceae bacterium]|nr:hypothetical protein [Cryptosporangiaceae bacterium]
MESRGERVQRLAFGFGVAATACTVAGRRACPLAAQGLGEVAAGDTTGQA